MLFPTKAWGGHIFNAAIPHVLISENILLTERTMNGGLLSDAFSVGVVTAGPDSEFWWPQDEQTIERPISNNKFNSC